MTQQRSIAVIGAGMMGAAVGRLLAVGGARVLTPLDGRGDTTRARARDAGMIAATMDQVAQCDTILSIVAPSQAMPVAQALLPFLAEAPSPPLFVECNAIHPEEARAIAALLAPARVRFADAGIVGGPPAPGGGSGPRFYASGPDAAEFAALGALGLDIRVLDAPAGSASALKMAFAAASKGLTGLLAFTMALAEREQVSDALIEQLRISHPGPVAWAERQFPQLAYKAPRWVEEMQILSSMLADVPGAAHHFRGLSELFAAIGTEIPSTAVEGWAATLKR
ncbi:NAD(P)-binding domain-containing protein [Sphingomonas canadensis]|uniref:NAD(P)-binding domain-containing protein n=1 Tax=Sphingomonas canadensis TaxID=1219257 RepID=A0ABW3HB16_9SPHN|nr:NAD(P)-dependent oxidoreductase [Sphingomonas canadensis]MCW3838308.1 NAD(P)-binding domain-containing protein [Sphingomonas canadensis]